MGMRELAVMDRSGDIKTIWDSDKPEEVEVARKQFADLTTKGYAIFRVDKKGEKGTKMHEFDPGAEKMIAVGRIAAG